jgi:hypothetical protein
VLVVDPLKLASLMWRWHVGVWRVACGVWRVADMRQRERCCTCTIVVGPRWRSLIVVPVSLYSISLLPEITPAG